jgi:hypothetical protein
MDITVWYHTIRNAYQDQILPHPLHSPITIFKIHNISHVTTLITNNNTYRCYDSLNLRSPPAAIKIHNTLRQWHSRLDIEHPLLRQATSNIHIQSAPQQTDGWTCGMHMILINLTTIYQGNIPIPKHTQSYVKALSRSHLRHVLTGELDTYITLLVRGLSNKDNGIAGTPRTYKTLR